MTRSRTLIKAQAVESRMLRRSKLAAMLKRIKEARKNNEQISLIYKKESGISITILADSADLNN